MVWPAAVRGWELLNGVKMESNDKMNPAPSHMPDRTKRPAEAAFGPEKNADYLQQETFDDTSTLFGSNQGQNGVHDLGTRIMAHMLGLDLPGIEPSTSYYPGYEWWPRSYGDSPSSQDPSSQEISPSPMDPRDPSPPTMVMPSSCSGHMMTPQTTTSVPDWSGVPAHYSQDYSFSL